MAPRAALLPRLVATTAIALFLCASSPARAGAAAPGDGASSLLLRAAVPAPEYRGGPSGIDLAQSSASDAENPGGAEAPGRRLEEEEFDENGGDDLDDDDDDDDDDGDSEGEDEEEDEDEGHVWEGSNSGDGQDEVVSGEGDEDEGSPTEEDNDASYGSEDLATSRDDRDEDEEGGGGSGDYGEDGSAERDDRRPSVEGSDASGGGGRPRRGVAPPGNTEPRGGRHEDVAPPEKYIARDDRGRVSPRGGPSGGEGRPSHRGTDRREESEEERGRPRTEPRDDSDEKREEGGAADNFEDYRHTDAYKNTMREFEARDIQHGKPVGYHFSKMREDRAAEFRKQQAEVDARLREARRAAQRDAGGPRPPPWETARPERKPQNDGGDATEPYGREAARNVFPSVGRSGGGGRGERGRAEEERGEERIMRGARDEPPARMAPRSPRSIRGGGEGARSERIDDRKSLLGRDTFPGGPYAADGNPRHGGPIPFPNIHKPQDRNPLLPPHDQMKIGGDHFVNPFSDDPVRAKKFEEYLARRKQALERREKWKHPIQSITGGQSATEEDIRAAHMKKSPMRNYKSQYNRQVPDLRPEAQRKSLGQKVLKNIPIVKRAFKRSKGEETLNDAALSFTRGLLMGVFKSNEALDYKRKAALVDWFDLLRVSLPPEIGLHDLIDTLKYNIDLISQRQENLLEVINKHPLPDNMWSHDCTKGMRSGGFFCGFWKLLHVASVGFAEQEGGLVLRESSPSARAFSPREAGDVVREYMAYFFNCEKCSKRFIGKYDDCSFDRCHRLVDDAAGASAESWREFPLWIWQVHNDISISKSDRAASYHKKEGRKAEARKWELSLKAVYPHIDQCIACVTTEGTWELTRVYMHLEREYWTFGDEVVLDPKMEKFLKATDIEPGNAHGLGAYVLVALIMISSLYLKKYRMRATGWHKKVETPSVVAFSKKYRDS